jgi:hypothetical protein
MHFAAFAYVGESVEKPLLFTRITSEEASRYWKRERVWTFALHIFIIMRNVWHSERDSNFRGSSEESD